MLIAKSVAELQLAVEAAKNAHKSIGFVPTMGALHAGHLALVRQSVNENDFNVVSIFVNPTQFNNANDLEKYPRNLDADANLLREVGCDLIFAPSVSEVYTESEKTQTFVFDFEGLDKVMEGKFRPGHFNGVVQIVSKLFTLVQPSKSYFGEKDYQQLAIIHLMTERLNFGTEIVDCAIVREPSGLAMSSRNERLSTHEREVASNISAILMLSVTKAEVLTPDELTAWVVGEIAQVDGLRLEYFEVAHAQTLQPVSDWTVPTIGCIAVFCGDVRLIDNIRYQIR